MRAVAAAGATPLRGRRRAAWLFDAAVALLACLQTLPFVLEPVDVASGFLLVNAVALSAPLVLRRVRPLPVFGFLYAYAAVVGWWAPQSVFTIALLIAFYTVTVQCARPWAVGGAVLLGVGVTTWAFRFYTVWRPVAIVLALVIVATLASGLYAGARRALLAELRERAARLERERDQQAVLAAAAERARIAREMHDIVAHHLTVMVSLADGAAAHARRSPERAEQAMQVVASTGREALSDTRRLLGVLREPAEDTATRSPLPTAADLDDLLDGVRAAGLHVDYRVEGSVPALDHGRGLAVYRLVQEALTNTLRHAQARRAVVELCCDDAALRVRVTDDGRGGAAPTGAGRGLIGMRERFAAVGGSVEFGPARPTGWSVRGALPLPEAT